MNAQEIKNILIAYLKAANHEIRIYQEKSIGNAVCDLMTVTNCLTGYEIKSDLDNYQRLDHQITAYDRFFVNAKVQFIRDYTRSRSDGR